MMRLAISCSPHRHPQPRAMQLIVWCDHHRYVPRVHTDNFRAAPLDPLQVDVFRAFVETLPPVSGGEIDG